MKNCVRCHSAQLVKSGVINKRQRYKCQECNYHFTVVSSGNPAKIKRLALHLWLEGLSLRRISRILNLSDVAVGKWLAPVKQELLPYRQKTGPLKELHSLEHFMITKKMFNQYGWLIIGMEENENTCLLGTTETRNCQLKPKNEMI